MLRGWGDVPMKLPSIDGIEFLNGVKPSIRCEWCPRGISGLNDIEYSCGLLVSDIDFGGDMFFHLSELVHREGPWKNLLAATDEFIHKIFDGFEQFTIFYVEPFPVASPLAQDGGELLDDGRVALNKSETAPEHKTNTQRFERTFYVL